MKRYVNELPQLQVDQRSSRHSKPSFTTFIVITSSHHITHHSPRSHSIVILPFLLHNSSNVHQSKHTNQKTPIQSPPYPQSPLLIKTTLHSHHNHKPIISNTTTKQKDSTTTTHQLQPNTPLPSHHFTPLHQHTSLTHQLTIAYAPTAFSRNR